MQTRGERNNNPGNIRKSSIRWLGEILGNDIGFETFDTPEHGIRAMVKILLTYYNVYKLDTIRKIIERWAPRSENNSEAYINFVSNWINRNNDEKIDLHDPVIMDRLVYAIIKYENGRVVYTNEQIKDAIDMVMGY